MSVITSKALDSNDDIEYFAIKTIDINAVRMGILNIAVYFDKKLIFMLIFYNFSYILDIAY